jgi:hypothetical protein
MKFLCMVNIIINYSGTCLNRTMNKPKFCIHKVLNKVLMKEIFVNLAFINRTQRLVQIVLQIENCSDGFNVPREHTAKLYIVGKTLMWSIEKFCSYE